MTCIGRLGNCDYYHCPCIYGLNSRVYDAYHCACINWIVVMASGLEWIYSVGIGL